MPKTSAILNKVLGKEYTFSALRVFGRWNQDNQCIKEAAIYVSDDGTNWVQLDNYSDSYTQVRKSFDESVGVFNNGAAMAKYASTGDVYTDVTTKLDDTAYNVKARYVKLEAIKTGGNHWHTQEIMLVKEDDANETKTVAELKELSEVEEVLDDYYTNASNWTWTAGTANGSVGKLYDGAVYGNHVDCWHSDTGLENNEAGRTVTIMFDEPTAVGGVRIYPRTISGGGTPNVIKLKGTYDGGNTWVDILPDTTLGFTQDKEEHKEAYLYHGRNNTFDGIKVISVKSIGGSADHTCFTELQVLKPVTPRGPLGEDEVTMGYPVGNAKVYGVKGDVATERNAGKGTIIYDGIYLTPEWFNELGGSGNGYPTYQIHNNFCIGSTAADSVYIIYDLGKVYEFSGIRLYQRVNRDQNFKEGYISISEDGENWVTSDKITVSPSVISAISDVKFGGAAYNMKTQYIKIHCTLSKSQHWAFEEVRLLQADKAKATKTPSEITEILTFVDNLDSRINMITKATNEVQEGEFTNHQYGLEGRCMYKPHKE